MTPTDPFSCLAEAIEAQDTPRFPAAISRWLAHVTAADNVTLLAYLRGERPRVYHSQAREPRVHERLGSAYVDGAYLLDPFHQLHLDGAPDGLYRLSDIAPDKFTRGEYFETYYANTTLTDEIGYVVSPGAGATVTICLGRDASSGRRFSARDLAAAQDIAPVCLALMRRHWAGLRPDSAAAGDASVAEVLRANTEAHLGIALSPRQAEVAVLILKGHSTGSAALVLDLSPETIKVFRKQLYRRCAISSQAELFSLLLPMLGQPAGR